MTAMLTVTAKNQITLPAGMLAQLNISKGDRLFFRIEGDSLKVEKVDVGLKSLQGSLSTTPRGRKFSLEEIIKMAEEKEAKRLADEV